MHELDRPRIEVDFNELIAENLVLLSREDAVRDSSGRLIGLHVGLRVHLFMEDADESGAPQYLLATGLAELNDAHGWGSSVRWRCRIDKWEQF